MRKRKAPVVLMLAVGSLALAASAVVLLTVVNKPASDPKPDTRPPLADEAALLAAPTGQFTLWRFGADPDIVVAIFSSLHEQAMALNRVAAFVERPGVSRDHILDDGALRAVIGQAQESFDTYYYGHDYRAADLARFFATAARDGLALHDAERALKTRLDAAGFFKPDAQAALISLPPRGEGMLDPAARATILHHELAHGAYFTDPRYAAYVVKFWNGLTEQERGAFRRYLGQQGYDMANDDLMRNETQAYLMFTGDPRMFDITRLGLPEAEDLRRTFLSGLQLAWLRGDAAEK
jgi:hypothetical protein